jgi:hypothetical protein
MQVHLAPHGRVRVFLGRVLLDHDEGCPVPMRRGMSGVSPGRKLMLSEPSTRWSLVGKSI